MGAWLRRIRGRGPHGGCRVKHTPGPWRYVRENGSPTTGQHMIAGAVPGYLAQLRDCGSGDVTANARLIAAAPRMYARIEMLASEGDAEAQEIVEAVNGRA